MQKILWWLILIVILSRLGFFLVGASWFFLPSFDQKYLTKLYSQSQYVTGSASKGIGDDGLYAFAGYYYFFQKGDVTKVNFEHPPLGKYLIGLSIWLFQNENVINLFYFAGLLIAVYYLGKNILQHQVLALLPVLFVSVNSLFVDHLLRSMLDLPFTLFFLLAVYFFVKGLKQPFYFCFSCFFWALAFTSRFFPALVLLYPFLVVAVFYWQKRGLGLFFLSSWFIPLFYLIIHFSFFLNNHNFADFLKHKKWMLAWFTGSPIVVGNLLRVVFTGWYYNSVGDLQFTTDWNWLWPSVFFLGLIPFFFLNQKEWKNPSVSLTYGVTLIFTLYLIFLNLGLLKYLLPVYPLLAILAINNLKLIFTLFLQRFLHQSFHIRKTIGPGKFLAVNKKGRRTSHT